VLAAVGVDVYTEEQGWQGHGWTQPLVLFLHLPVVWERQGQVQGNACSRSRVFWGTG
jgi:hypothetical protein